MRVKIGGVIGAVVAGLGLWSSTALGQGVSAVALLLKVDKTAYSYTREGLQALATVQYQTFRGDKTNTAVSLEMLLTKDTQLSPEKIRRVVVVGEEKVLLLEGEHLKLLKDLVVKIGNKQLSLAATSPEVEERLRPLWGKPRIEKLVRIYVTQGN